MYELKGFDFDFNLEIENYLFLIIFLIKKILKYF